MPQFLLLIGCTRKREVRHHLCCPQQHKAESPMGSMIAYALFSLSVREMTAMPLGGGKKFKKKKRKFEFGGEISVWVWCGFRSGFH